MARDASFDAVDREPGSGRRITTIILGGVLVALVMSAAVGYGLGRGAWHLPSKVTAKLPQLLLRALPTFVAVPARIGTTAELKDFGFELVSSTFKQGEAILAVRLLDTRSGKPVPDAVVFAHRLDMAPEGMPTMIKALEPQPSTEPGVYRFKADLAMEGGWQLSLGAKVQGESGTVQSKLLLKVDP
jgi:hypothetical protein